MLWRIFVATALALFLAACGESSEPLSATVAEPDGDEPPTFAAATPIDRFFEETGGQQGSLERWKRQVWEATVTCMKANGFEMVVDVPQPSERQTAMSRLTEREWTEIYGYGLTDSFAEVLADQLGDPNERIVATLTEAEREQYLVSLVGDELALAAGRLDEAPPLEDQGCSGSAVLANGGQDLVDGLGSFETAHAARISRLQAGSEMIAANDAWVACMAASGYPDYADQDQIVAAVQARILATTATFRSSLSRDELDELVGLSVSELRGMREFPVAAFDDIATWETDLALADLTCYETYVAATWEQLRDAEEYALIDEYGDVLVRARSELLGPP